MHLKVIPTGRRIAPAIRACAWLLAASAAVAGADGARMYEWRQPGTGTVQLSGTAPSWYRGTVPGPRVRVHARGRVVDDTAWEVPDDERAALRAAALGNTSSVPLVEDANPASLPEPGAAVPAPPPSTNPEPASIGADDLAHYKAVVEAWDRAERERAEGKRPGL